jgi:hypothetical protein
MKVFCERVRFGPIFRVCFVSVIVIQGGENRSNRCGDGNTAGEVVIHKIVRTLACSQSGENVLCDDSRTQHGVMAGVVLYLGGSQGEVGEFELSFCA